MTELTDDLQQIRLAPLRLRVDLALVDARVGLGGAADLEVPVVRRVRVVGREARVRRVRRGAQGQDVQVGLADPGHLQGRGSGARAGNKNEKGLL